MPERPDRPSEPFFVTLPPPRDTEEGSESPPATQQRDLGTSRAVGPVMLLALLVVGGALGLGLVRWVAAGDASTVAAGDGATTSSRAYDEPGDSGFAFWARHSDGDPVRWNPCEPIRWVLNPDGAPTDAHDDISAAGERIHAATGIELEYAGTTDEPARRDRSPYQGERYGDRWAPVLIAWQDPDDTDLPLRDDDRAVAVPVALDTGDGSTFVTAQMVFNRDRDLVPGFADRSGSLGATVLHELGHVVGLDHVDDPRQLMYAYPGDGPATFAAGDLAGLKALGREAGCRDTPEAGPVDVDYVQDFGR